MPRTAGGVFHGDGISFWIDAEMLEMGKRGHTSTLHEQMQKTYKLQHGSVYHNKDNSMPGLYQLLSVAMVGHHDQGHLQKKEFIWADGSRRRRASWWGGMAVSSRHVIQRRKLRTHVLSAGRANSK